MLRGIGRVEGKEESGSLGTSDKVALDKTVAFCDVGEDIQRERRVLVLLAMARSGQRQSKESSRPEHYLTQVIQRHERRRLGDRYLGPRQEPWGG